MEAELTKILNAVQNGHINVTDAKKEIIDLIRNTKSSLWEIPSLEKIVFVEEEGWFFHKETSEIYSFTQLIQYGHSANTISRLIFDQCLEKDKNEGLITEEEYLKAKSYHFSDDD